MLGLGVGMTLGLGVFLFILVVGTFLWLSAKATPSPVTKAGSKAYADKVQREQGVSGTWVQAQEQEYRDANPL